MAAADSPGRRPHLRGVCQELFEYDLMKGEKRTYNTKDEIVLEYNPLLAGKYAAETETFCG